MSAIPDGSDKSLSAPRSDKAQNWSAKRWIRFVKEHPDCTLPSGVADLIIRHYERMVGKAYHKTGCWIHNELVKGCWMCQSE